jgi:hypothetical protein
MECPGAASERGTDVPRVSSAQYQPKGSGERNVMMTEALDGVGWSAAYARSFSEIGPKNSENGWTNIGTAIPPRWTPRPREAAAC